MWQETQSDFLRSEIRGLLDSIPFSTRLRSLVEEPLAKSSRGLDKEEQNHPFPLLPLVVCEAVSGDYEQAAPAAVAIQFLTAAADVLDDIQDQDSAESLSSRYGNPLATNAAVMLFSLAWRAMARLAERGVSDKITVGVFKAVSSYCITAANGQQRDIALGCANISEKAYLKIAGMKSAAQIECACHVGALIGGANNKLIDKFRKFGYNLGMAAQITNDIMGITQGGDLMKPKISLPVVYVLSQTRGDIHHNLETTFFKRQVITASDAKKIADLMFKIGAIHYAIVKMEAFKQQAADILSSVKVKGVKIGKLKIFLK